jgi:asparagine synthase (glutamine-hydrolysing)
LSGIAGLKNDNIDKSIKGELSKMLLWNKAYGDEATDQLEQDQWSLGVCYEHITNSPILTSPVLEKESFSAVIDAVIYNRTFLLKKYNLAAILSDEEIIFEIIIQKGLSSLADINGDFAGAMIDKARDILFLFRDHLGIRPLFYYMSDDLTAFSTDIRGLLANSHIPGEVNKEWLYKNICGYDTESLTQTEVKDIYQVPPASFITITNNNGKLVYETNSYWRLGSHKTRFLTARRYRDKLRELVTASIKDRLDVFPGLVGSELSGGLDSGVISILINRLGREAIYYSWSPDTKTVPLVENDERLVIDDICNQENITCNFESDWILDSTSNLGKSHEALGLKYDSQLDIYRNYALPLYTNSFIIAQTSQFVNCKGAKVIFSGHGGDEGVSHRGDPFELFYHKEYLHYIKLTWDLTKGQKHRLLQTYRQAKGKASSRQRYLSTPYVSYQNAPQILSKELSLKYTDVPMPANTFSFDVIKYINDGSTNLRPKTAALLGAYSGARYVFPFLDKDVIDYAVSIPRYLFQNGKIKRYIFREAFKDIMPPSLYSVSIKDTPSESAENNTPTSDWFTSVSKYGKEMIDSLDRAYWERYLDYEVLDRWIKSPRPSDENKQAYLNVAIKIRDCLRFQSMVDSIKKI